MFRPFEKKAEEQKSPLHKKWGYEDVKACSALEATRREFMSKLRDGWENLTEEQRSYCKDMLDYEQQYSNGEVTDWRLFFKQPRRGAKHEVKLDGWWHKPLELLGRTPPEGLRAEPKVSQPVQALDLIKSVFPDATIAKPLELMYRKRG